MSEKIRLFVLGASDPEMVAIEKVLRACGEKIAFACDENRKRVYPGNAYKAAGAIDGDGSFCQIPGEDTVVLVECTFDKAHPLQPGRVQVYTDPQAGGPVYFPSSGAEEYNHDQTVVVCDHHRPGDPGYGRGPEEFLAASSLGQVISLLVKEGAWPAGREWQDRPQRHNLRPAGEFYRLPEGRWVVAGASALGGYYAAVPDQLLMVAAADHCLEAAYRGKCPGVDPDELMRWRIETRAAFQKRTVEAVLADVAKARERLRLAVCGEPWTEQVHSSHLIGWLESGYNLSAQEAADMSFEEARGGGLVTLRHPSRRIIVDILSMEDRAHYEQQAKDACDEFHGGYAVVADFRGETIPELPEAAAREGIPFITTVKEKDGREKVVLQAASPDLVRRFMAGEIVPEMRDIYGDPARGFAGGYVA